MRSAAVDCRLISPPASQYALNPTRAYLDRDEIVITSSASGDLAVAWLPVVPGAQIIGYAPLVFIPDQPDALGLYWAPSFHGPARQQVSGGVTHTRRLPPVLGEWARTAPFPTQTAPPGARWLRHRIFGADAGTRLRPGPGDFTVQYKQP